MIKRLLMQDLLYEMPDTKTQKTSWDKNWERIPQPNAAAQTLGVRGLNNWVKIVISKCHFQRFSIELNTVQPLILAKKSFTTTTQ